MSKVLTALVALSLLVPASAFAQNAALNASKNLRDKSAKAAPKADDEGDSEDAPSVEGSQKVIDGEAPQIPVQPEQGQPNSQHTVERGDTLWDLSQKYLGSPWYWPKVWSYNPEIANPHWIYPGNHVRFYNGGEDVPTQVEVGDNPDEESGDMLSGDEDDKVQVVGKLGYTPKNSMTLQATGFVTSTEVEGLGSITGSFAESEMLSAPDNVYVEFTKPSDAKMGDTYVVFRTSRELTNPFTGESIGFLTHILGEAKVVRVTGNKVTMTISKSYDGISRGDRIGPSNENVLRTLSPRPNDRSGSGIIVSSDTGVMSIMGEHHVVVVDRGSEAGLKPGNLLTVYRQGDMGGPTALVDEAHKDPDYPKEDVGQCLAFEVKSKASTCLLIRSIRQIVPGDSWEMRPSTGQTARR